MKQLYITTLLLLAIGAPYAQTFHSVTEYGDKDKAKGFLVRDTIYLAKADGITRDTNKIIGMLRDNKIYSVTEYNYKNKIVGYFSDGKVYSATEDGMRKDKVVGFYKDGNVLSVSEYGESDKIIAKYKGSASVGAACIAFLRLL